MHQGPQAKQAVHGISSCHDIMAHGILVQRLCNANESGPTWLFAVLRLWCSVGSADASVLLSLPKFFPTSSLEITQETYCKWMMTDIQKRSAFISRRTSSE